MGSYTSPSGLVVTKLTFCYHALRADYDFSFLEKEKEYKRQASVPVIKRRSSKMWTGPSGTTTPHTTSLSGGKSANKI